MLHFSRRTRVNFRTVKFSDGRQLSENLTYEHLAQYKHVDISEILAFRIFSAIRYVAHAPTIIWEMFIVKVFPWGSRPQKSVQRFVVFLCLILVDCHNLQKYFNTIYFTREKI